MSLIRGCAEEPPKSGISHLGNQYAQYSTDLIYVVIMRDLH